MKCLSASWLITSDESRTIIHNGAIVYDTKIVDVGTKEYIQEKYPHLVIEDLGKNSVLMPGLINTHVHLEFSSNATTLKYGNFLSWLHSVIASREMLVEKATTKLIREKLEGLKRGGTTTIGAISSYGFDVEACVQSSLNVVLFNEVIGSKPDMIDTLFADFKARLRNTQKHASNTFIPAIAIHSPYSVHPFLIRETLKVAKEENLCVSAHFLESPEEFEWLHKDEGDFLHFFKNFLGQEKAVTRPMEFLNQFDNLKNVSFTHCVEASTQDLEKIKALGAVINHCVTSNRFLNNSKLDIKKLMQLNIPFSLGTDGLSSNISLCMFDELRNALMMHNTINMPSLSQTLIESATRNGSRALGLNKGVLEKNKDADIIALVLPQKVLEEEDVCMHVILHTKEVARTIIGGKDV